MTPDIIGSIGVAMLLAAFGANLSGVLDREGLFYQSLNAVGAAIAAYASWLIVYMPFVVLEGVWALVSLVAIARTLHVKAKRRRHTISR